MQVKACHLNAGIYLKLVIQEKPNKDDSCAILSVADISIPIDVAKVVLITDLGQKQESA